VPYALKPITIDLESEIEAAVLTALEAGEGCVPGFYGTEPRENEEPVTHAISQALDYAWVMEILQTLLKTEPAKELREAIAKKYAERVVDGVREAREDAAEMAAMER
jgi:hypothetical protein